MTQRDDKWQQDRWAKLTASRFKVVVGASDTKGRREYYDQLVDQRLGIEDFTDVIEKPWFEHGRDNEDAGIARYALYLEMGNPDLTVEAHPDFRNHIKIKNVGCSADALVHGDPEGLGGMELKCVSSNAADNQKKFFPKDKDGNVLPVKVPSGHLPQIMGNMWIYGAIWWDFVSFCPYVEPEYQLYVKRVFPDKNYYKRLENECKKLNKEIDDTVKQINKAIA